MRIAATSLAVLALSLPASARAQQASDFKSMTIVVGFSPGGGYDAYARLLARYLDRYLPGAPKAVVQNMPGASGMKSVLYLDTPSAAKDGTVVTAFNPGLIIESLMTPQKIGMRFDQVSWVGSISKDFRVCYSWAETGIKTFADLVAYPQFNIGAPAAGSSAYINAAELKSIYGVKVRHVTGYPGSAEERLAIERRELDGGCGAWSSNPPNWIEQKKINPLVTFSADPVPNLKEPVPYAPDLAKTPEDKALVKLLSGADPLGRPYVVSKSVPPERLAALRRAFDRTVKDPDFLADAAKMDLPISPIDGVTSEKMIGDIYSVPDKLVARAREVMQ
jgi:tripartite-type tricarboxylate transporter receptor subunit TctC